VLYETLERSGSVDLARQFAPRVPEDTVSLREIGLWAEARLFDHLTISHDPGVQPERARLLNSIGTRLRALGRYDDAVSATKKAVLTFRELAAREPGRFTLQLARSLDNFSRALASGG